MATPTISASLAYNATRFGAIPQVAGPAALAGSPLAATIPQAAFAGAWGAPQGAFVGAPWNAGLAAGYPAGLAGYASRFPAGYGAAPAAFAPTAFAPAAYGPAAAYSPAATLAGAYGHAAAFGPAAAYGAYAPATYGALQQTVVGPQFAGAIPAAGPFSNALVPAVGAHLVDDWSAAHGYGIPATYGYGSIPAATAVAVGGAANLYDSRLVGTAAANPALYAASYGAQFAPSYVPAALNGVPTFGAFAGTNVAATNVLAAQGFQGLGLTSAYAPNYFNGGAVNAFSPSYFGGFAGQYGGQAVQYGAQALGVQAAYY